MRGHLLFAEAQAFAEDHAQNQSGPSGGHVNHGSACKVDCFDGGTCIPHSVHQTVDAPNHMSERKVDDEHPSSDKEEDGREFNPLGNRADN